MEFEYTGNLESVWGNDHTTSTTTDDWSSDVASPCCCCTPTSTTRIPVLHFCSTSRSTGRTKSTRSTGSFTTIFSVSTGHWNTHGPSTYGTTTEWWSSHSGWKPDWHFSLSDSHPEPNRVQGMDQWQGPSKFWYERHHGPLHFPDAWCCQIQSFRPSRFETSQVWSTGPWTGSRWSTTTVLLSVTDPRVQAKSQNPKSPTSPSTKSQSSVKPWSCWACYDFPHIKSRGS